MTAPGYQGEKAAVLRRLGRVEGQVRGIAEMVQSERYCVEVLDQIAAATRALQGVALALLGDHLSHCVARAVAAGGTEAEEKLAEATAAISRLVRS